MKDNLFSNNEMATLNQKNKNDVPKKVTFKPYDVGENYLFPPTTDDYIGKHCQIISKTFDIKKEFEEVFYDFGIIKEVNHQEGFILINTSKGFISKKFEDIYDILPINDDICKTK